MISASTDLTPLPQLVRERDALNVRLHELIRQTSEADAATGRNDIDPRSQAILQEYFEAAECRELDVDRQMAKICATILMQPPTSEGDLVLKAQTVAFIMKQVTEVQIWDFDRFQDEIAAFAKQVEEWERKEAANV